MNMRQDNSGDLIYSRSRASDLSMYMTRVYSWMMVGIMLTGVVAYVIGSNPEWVARIFSNSIFFIAVVIVQLGAVFYLSAMIERISPAAAAITFLMYSALTGLTFSLIFAMYTQQSIAGAFVATSAGFAGLSLYGYTTRRDLGPIGAFCFMALIGLIVLSLLSYFIPSLNSNNIQLFYSIAGLVIFAGLTAYDTQRIKAIGSSAAGAKGQYAILGALILYLDFINLFMNLLRLMGDRR